MKKILIVFFIVSAFINCKNEAKPNSAAIGEEGFENKSDKNDGLTTISGEFSYYEDAAVLQVGNSSIYGIVLNEKMKELYTMGKQYRTEPTDGVYVQIRGKIIPKDKNKEGWPFNIDIKEIISVNKTQVQNEVIKIGK